MVGEDGMAEGQRCGDVPGRTPAAQAGQPAVRRQANPRNRHALDPFAADAVEGEDRDVGAGLGEAFGDLPGGGREAARCRRIIPCEERDAHQAASRRR